MQGRAPCRTLPSVLHSSLALRCPEGTPWGLQCADMFRHWHTSMQPHSLSAHACAEHNVSGQGNARHAKRPCMHATSPAPQETQWDMHPYDVHVRWPPCTYCVSSVLCASVGRCLRWSPMHALYKPVAQCTGLSVQRTCEWVCLYWHSIRCDLNAYNLTLLTLLKMLHTRL